MTFRVFGHIVAVMAIASIIGTGFAMGPRTIDNPNWHAVTRLAPVEGCDCSPVIAVPGTNVSGMVDILDAPAEESGISHASEDYEHLATAVPGVDDGAGRHEASGIPDGAGRK
jgi:hypothetical protein